MAWKLLRSGLAKSISSDGGVLLAGQFVAIHLRLEQQRLHRLIGVEQALARLTEDIVDQPRQMPLGKPFAAIGQRIERADAVAEHLRQDDVAKT